MTRAYLRVDKQRWVKGPYLGLRPDLYEGDKAFLAAESCHEACMILDHNGEALTATSTQHHYVGLNDSAWARPAGWQALLVESLAAFIADPIK